MTARRWRQAITLTLLCVNASLLAAADTTPSRRPLLLFADRDYAPLSYVEDGMARGMDVDIAQALAVVLDRRIRIELIDWHDAQQRVLRGEGDGLLSMSITPERAAQYDFTAPTSSHEFGLFVRSGSRILRDTGDLTARWIAVTPGGLPRLLLDRSGAQFELVQNYQDGFDRLAIGRVEAVAADVWVAAHTLEQRNMHDIVMAGAPLAAIPAGIAVKKGNTALVHELDEGIRRLKANGTLAHIQARWRPHEMLFMSRGRVVQLAAATGAALLVAAGTLLIMSFRARCRARAERRRVETAAQALRTSEDKYRQVVENANDVIFTVDRDGYCLSMNRAGRELSGYVAEEPRGVHLTQIVAPEQTEAALRQLRRVLHGDVVPRFELDIVSQAGKRVTLELDVRPVEGGTGIAGVRGIAGAQGIARDVTARKELEAQLRQAQKMEAIGRLAGGIAHDFNNILTVVMGCSELAASQLDGSSPVRREIDEIQRAGRSAASLTQQLLIFSRTSATRRVVLDLNEAVNRLNRMLRRLVGEHIRMTVSLGAGLGHIAADAGQIEQVVMNLVVNARDAMPSGGTLTIETDSVILDERFAGTDPESAAGRYVRLRVSDTGVGMTPEVQAEIFLPFFTTKGPSAGTGLGLATVHGIVKESGGFITVESTPGHGAAFAVYFPAVEAPAERCGPRADEPAILMASGTILFVEDDDQIRLLGARALRRHGFRVLTARHAAEAVALAGDYGDHIDLLLTDLIMPGLNGHELATELQRSRPDLPVVYTSGYADDSAVVRDLQDAGANFVPKPYAPITLARKVHEVLARR